MVLARQAIVGRRLVDIFVDPAGELWYRPPLGEPAGEIAVSLGEIGSVVEPPHSVQAVVADPSRHMVERVLRNAHSSADRPLLPESHGARR
jgi:hypothetical protein